MVRFVIFVIMVITCNAGRLEYNYNHGYNYPPLVNREEVTKSFYFFSAPDDEVPEPSTNRVLSNVKKNIQVVVIKAPEYNAYANAAVNLARQAIQAKTLIYVLSRQPDEADLQRRFQEIQTSNVQKPEVRFVKYRTPEEAERAQEAIKLQYDSLPGSSNSLAGADPPVLDYSQSSSTTSDDDELFTVNRPPFLPTGVDVVPGSSYLPPKRD